DCAGPEICVSGRCQDSNNEHCVVFRVFLESAANVVSKDYTLVVDALPRSLAGEPTNDTRANAVDYSPGPHSLSPTGIHTQPYDDDDWYVLPLDAGTQFQVNLRAASPYTRVYVYQGTSTSGVFIYPYEPTN